MFSDHMPRTHSAPREYFYLGVGAVLVASLLIAIAAVASKAVEKAAMRDSTLASQRSAAAYCVETRRGAELNLCLKQARQDAVGEPVKVAGSGATAKTMAATEDAGPGRAASIAGASAQGLIPASFGNLR